MEQDVMRSMTYRGDQMSTLMGRIRRDLGEEAVILSSRQVGPRLLEVVAGNSAAAIAGNAPRDQKLREALLATAEMVLPRVASGAPVREVRVAELSLSEVLAAHGVAPQIISQFTASPSAGGLTAELQIAQGFSQVLGFDTRLPAEKKFVALVGPTGAGKTTTIAKLAARLQMASGARIAFISMDNFRVGAGFQLQTYASLLRVPCRMLDPHKPAAEELTRAKEAFAKFDLVIIDTAGSSPRDRGRINELAGILQARDTESLLVLPAAGNEADSLETLQGFAPLGCDRVILSKLDESGFVGPVLNSLIRSDRTLAFFTTGQRVPEDIEPASARRLGWMLTKTVQ